MEKKMGVWLCCIAVLLAVIWGIGYAEDIIHKGSRVKHSEAGSSQSMLSGSSVTLASTPWSYKVTGPNNSNLVAVNKLNEVVYFELDATVPNYVWGNIVVLYDKTKLNAVSLEENPDNWYGFWTWWTYATGQSVYGGGGNYYYYDYVAGTSVANQGSQWAQDWVNIYGGGGPVGTIDPNYGSALDLNSADYQALINKGISNISNLGAIRLYTSTYAGGQYWASPLRVGFEVISTSDAVFDVFANDSTSYNFHPAQLDSYLRSTVTLALESPPCPNMQFDTKTEYGSTVTITGPLRSPPDTNYNIHLTASTEASIFQWSLYEDGVYIDGSGFSFGSSLDKTSIFSKAVMGSHTYLLRFRGIGGAHGWPPYTEVSITVNITFVPTIEDIITLLNQCYENGEITDYDVYLSLLSKLQAVQSFLANGSLTSAMGQLHAFINETTAQENKAIASQCAENLRAYAGNLLAATDLTKAKEDAKEEIDKKAAQLKKAIDQDKKLTPAQKEERKAKIDKIAEDGKKYISTLCATASPEDVGVILGWVSDSMTQVKDGTDTCAPGFWCDVSVGNNSLSETKVNEVRLRDFAGGDMDIQINASGPQGATIYGKGALAGSGQLPNETGLNLPDTNPDSNNISSTISIPTRDAKPCDFVYVKIQIMQKRSFIFDWLAKDTLQCEKKFLIHFN